MALAEALHELCTRANGGESLAALQLELVDRLVPWARRHAESLARRLPSWADGNELTSRVLDAVWHCCQRFDPERTEAWGALLWARVRGASLDAARADDPLSRRHRWRLSADGADAHTSQRALAADEEQCNRLVSATPDPAHEVVATAVARAVERWLRHDLPEEVAGRLVSWWHRTGAVSPLPPNLALAIDGYVFRLAPTVALVED